MTCGTTTPRANRWKGFAGTEQRQRALCRSLQGLGQGRALKVNTRQSHAGCLDGRPPQAGGLAAALVAAQSSEIFWSRISLCQRCTSARFKSLYCCVVLPIGSMPKSTSFCRRQVAARWMPPVFAGCPPHPQACLREPPDRPVQLLQCP